MKTLGSATIIRSWSQCLSIAMHPSGRARRVLVSLTPATCSSSVEGRAARTGIVLFPVQLDHVTSCAQVLVYLHIYYVVRSVSSTVRKYFTRNTYLLKGRSMSEHSCRLFCCLKPACASCGIVDDACRSTCARPGEQDPWPNLTQWLVSNHLLERMPSMIV